MKKTLAVFYGLTFLGSAAMYGLAFFGYKPDLSFQVYLPLLMILSFNYISLRWTSEVTGFICEKEKYKVPARLLFFAVLIVTMLQIVHEAFSSHMDEIMMFLSYNMFFSLLMSYSYAFGKRRGKLVLFKFFE